MSQDSDLDDLFPPTLATPKRRGTRPNPTSTPTESFQDSFPGSSSPTSVGPSQSVALNILQDTDGLLDSSSSDPQNPKKRPRATTEKKPPTLRAECTRERNTMLQTCYAIDPSRFRALLLLVELRMLAGWGSHGFVLPYDVVFSPYDEDTLAQFCGFHFGASACVLPCGNGPVCSIFAVIAKKDKRRDYDNNHVRIILVENTVTSRTALIENVTDLKCYFGHQSAVYSNMVGKHNKSKLIQLFIFLRHVTTFLPECLRDDKVTTIGYGPT
eukprot:PhF_6_TR44470/c1_g1_i2/m.68461